jgi:hypothetical protein
MSSLFYFHYKHSSLPPHLAQFSVVTAVQLSKYTSGCGRLLSDSAYSLTTNRGGIGNGVVLDQCSV